MHRRTRAHLGSNGLLLHFILVLDFAPGIDIVLSLNGFAEEDAAVVQVEHVARVLKFSGALEVAQGIPIARYWQKMGGLEILEMAMFINMGAMAVMRLFVNI